MQPMDSMNIQTKPAAVQPAPPPNPLITVRILPMLVRLAVPNAVASIGATLVAIAETSYIGRLGTEPLAAIALVFPFVMLTQMMSAGAMGGGVSSAISRALGAGDQTRAATLAVHAAIIGFGGGLLFTAIMLVFGPALFALLGGSGRVLDEALKYSHVLFAGAASIWMVNTLASVLRGTGDMMRSSGVVLAVALIQAVIGGVLGLGFGPIPRLGMAGVAAGQMIAFTLGALFLAWFIISGRSRITLNFASFTFQRGMFFDILKVGAVSCLSPLQTVLTILIFTKIVASVGPAALAGYGIGARLEFLLVPISFALGVASIPMIGMAIGAKLVARARQVAWTAGSLAGLLVGIIGLTVWIAPDLWIGLFTQDAAVRDAARSYFAWAGLAYCWFGVGVCLYFSSQGAAKVGGPVIAGTVRLLMVVCGGWWLATGGSELWTLFALVAASMTAYGVLTIAIVRGTPWGETARA